MVSSRALTFLTALSYRGVGRAWIVKHHLRIQSTSAAVTLLGESLKGEAPISIEDFERRKEGVRRALRQSEAAGEGTVALGDTGFPSHRGDVVNGDRPVVLFYRGNPELLADTNRNIAVIGLLTPSQEAEALERLVVTGLVKRGATIVSGLAFGCDAIAHRQAMEAGGKTVAILPSPLSGVLPKAHEDLADEIVKAGGLLVSEYYDDATSRNQLSGRYLERNRLQAMFSDCVMLAASYSKNDQGLDSGSRHAMEYARRYSIPRAVMYDRSTHADLPEFDLNRRLMDDPGVVAVSRESAQREDALDKIVTGHVPRPRALVHQSGLFS